MLWNQRFVRMAASIVCLTVLTIFATDAMGQTAEQLLKEGVKQFKAGQADQAYATLRRVDAIQLNSDAQRTQLEETLAAARDQITANKNLAQATETERAGNLEAALAQYKAVTEDQSAARKTKERALAGIARVERAMMAGKTTTDVPEPVAVAAASPAEDEAVTVIEPANNTEADSDAVLQQAVKVYAQKLAAEAKAEAEAGNFNKAQKLYEEALKFDPENEAAAQGLHDVSDVLNSKGNGGVLVEVEKTYKLRKERAVARYEEAMRESAAELEAGNYDQAANNAIRAKSIISTNRQYIPEAEFQAMYAKALDQSAAVERQAEASRVEQIRAQEDAQAMENRKNREEAEAQTNKKINELLSRARDLSREQKYELALEQLDQVLFLDPTNAAAQFMQDIIKDQIVHERWDSIRRTRRDAQQRQSLENYAQTIAQPDLLTYPPDWPDLTLRRLGGGNRGADSEANRLTREKLRSPIPVDFQGNQLENVIVYLRDVTGVSIFVQWNSLANAGIPRTTPITMQLTNVAAEKVLRLILDEAGAEGIELGYTIDDGVIIIATKEDLATKTVIKTYDIRDLVLRPPNFRDAPEFDLSQVTADTSQGSSSSIFEENDQDEDEVAPQSERIIEIMDLIRESVDPENWRQTGGLTSSMNELNGMLIVTTTSENHQAIAGLLRQIRDQRALQIALDSRFLFVTDNFLEEVGVDVDFTIDSDEDWLVGPVTIGQDSISNARASGSTVPGTLAPVTTPNMTIGGPAGAALGFVLDDLRVDVLITATQADKRSVTVNTPRITFFNGQRANITISRQTAFVADLEPIVATNAVAFDPTIRTVNDGVVLDVEGTISADRRYVTLTVRPSLSQLVALRTFTVSAANNNNAVDRDGDGLTGEDPINGVDDDGDTLVDEDPPSGSAFTQGIIQQPETQVTRLRTTVSVPDKGTLMIGGQRLVGEVEIEQGVPVLSKIPGLNRLFTNRATVRDERTLLILIKPTIIVQSEEEDRLFPGLKQAPALWNLGN